MLCLRLEQWWSQHVTHLQRLFPRPPPPLPPVFGNKPTHTCLHSRISCLLVITCPWLASDGCMADGEMAELPPAPVSPTAAMSDSQRDNSSSSASSSASSSSGEKSGGQASRRAAANGRKGSTKRRKSSQHQGRRKSNARNRVKPREPPATHDYENRASGCHTAVSLCLSVCLFVWLSSACEWDAAEWCDEGSFVSPGRRHAWQGREAAVIRGGPRGRHCGSMG